MAAQKDLTTGPLGKQVLAFSVPLIASNLLQVLFNMADVAGGPPGPSPWALWDPLSSWCRCLPGRSSASPAA